MRIKRWFRSLEPRVLAEFDRPILAWAKPWLDRHNLLAFTRRPLARGVAIGLLCGLIPGPFQVAATVLACSFFRANVVAGVVATFYTNPVTIVPLYIAAFHIGDRLIPGVHPLPPFVDIGFGDPGWVGALADWIQALGWPLVLGLPVMGLWFAVNGYWLTNYLWLRPVVARAKRIKALRLRRASALTTTE